MNAHEFFEKYSIETINKRTRISPISLRFIKNKEFEKIPRVKFLGFVRIIEKEFKVDFSELIQEYDQAINFKKEVKKEYVINKETKKSNTFLLLLLALSLLALGSYLLYKNYKGNKKYFTKKTYLVISDNNETFNDENNSQNEFEDDNVTENVNVFDENKTFYEINESIKEANETNKETNETFQKFTLPSNIQIIPNRTVWFRAKNLDTNKTVEFLINETKTLEGINWYLKFGHGDITIKYGNETITPDTKKIVRILFKNGKYEYLKSNNRYEK